MTTNFLTSRSHLLRAVACALLFIAAHATPAFAQTIITLPDGTVGTAYGPVQLTGQGAAAPVTWSAQPAPPGANALPPGITLNTSTGTLAGTPSRAGDYTFMLVVTDNGNPAVKGEQRVRMRINNALRIVLRSEER